MRKSRWYKRLLAIVFTGVLALLLASVWLGLPPLLPAQGNEILQNATRTEAFRPDRRPMSHGSSTLPPGAVEVGYYDMVRSEGRLKDDFTKRLAAVLLSRRPIQSLYPYTRRKDYSFVPASIAGFRIWQNGKYLDVALFLVMPKQIGPSRGDLSYASKTALLP